MPYRSLYHTSTYFIIPYIYLFAKHQPHWAKLAFQAGTTPHLRYAFQLPWLDTWIMKSLFQTIIVSTKNHMPTWSTLIVTWLFIKHKPCSRRFIYLWVHFAWCLLVLWNDPLSLGVMRAECYVGLYPGGKETSFL